MEKPVIVEDKSITTEADQKLVIDQKDLDDMAGKRVVIVDDVISTGGSLHALEALVSKKMCIRDRFHSASFAPSGMAFS